MAEVAATKAQVVAEKTTTEKEAPPAPEVEEPVKAAAAVEEVVEVEKAKPAEEGTLSLSVSFKEETNVVADLPENEKKALEEFKQLIQQALQKHEFTSPPSASMKEEEKKEEVKEQEKPAEEKAACAEDVAPAAPVEEKRTETAEPSKPEAEPEPEPAKEVKVEEKIETVVVAEVVETVTTTVDDDGAKTVEAIEETIVAVSSSTAAVAEAPAAPAEPEKKEEEVAAVPPPPPEEVSIWGIPLLKDERSDVILLKFLRARDFKVKDAFAMIKNAVRWRKDFGVESLLEEDLGNDLDKVVFMHGDGKDGHPVCYNVYQKTFSDEEKRKKFLRWRIQFHEKSIRKLDFSPNGINTIVQVTDLKNLVVPGILELRQALYLLQDNYPEFLAKQILINVPWWYLAINRMISPFMTQRTRSKFVYAGPSKSTETLFKYIAPELVPVQFGGLSRDGEGEFTDSDAANEITIKAATKQTVEFPASEACHLVWEVRVVGWDVSYGAEFVPSAEDGYTVIVQKSRKITSSEEPVLCNSFKIGEPGKIVLTIDNQSSKKKKLLYRSKTKPSSD